MSFRRSKNHGPVVHRLSLPRTPRGLQRQAPDPAAQRRAARHGPEAQEPPAEAIDPASLRRTQPARPDPRALDEAPAGRVLHGWQERRLQDGLTQAADRDERQRLEIQRLKARIEKLNQRLEEESTAREAAERAVENPGLAAGHRDAAAVEAARTALMDEILAANLELRKRITSLRRPAE